MSSSNPMPGLGFNHNGCTLLPCVRRLIETAHLMDADDEYVAQNYVAVWLPDMPLGPQRLRVTHDCTKTPGRFFEDGKPPEKSAGSMQAKGTLFAMSEAPPASHAVYVATCHNCRIIFFASAWDKEDTLENYAAKLKCQKGGRP